MGSLGPFPFIAGNLQRLLRQAGPVFAQVTPHRDHVISFSFRPPLPGDGLPLTHSPRREVVSGSVTRMVPTPRLLGVLLWQLGNCLFGLPARGSEGAPKDFTDHHVSRLLRLLSQAGSLCVSSAFGNSGVVSAVGPALRTFPLDLCGTSVGKFKTSPQVSAHPS